MGYDPSQDSMAVRMLKAVTVNSDLISDDELGELIGGDCTILGAAGCLDEDIGRLGLVGTVISAGSATEDVIRLGIRPDIVVTDLDGDIGSQLRASAMGAVTVIHAHGDNMDLIRGYAPDFRGPVVLSTQGPPENTVYNFGGFTDGDRAVCLADHFGARIHLRGFDFGDPSLKDGSDPALKRRKLRWAEEIIRSVCGGLPEARPGRSRPENPRDIRQSIPSNLPDVHRLYENRITESEAESWKRHTSH